MRKVAGTLKLDQAQYRELEAFAKFGAELDDATLAVLDKGAKNVEILKQGQYQPLPVEEQVAIIFCGTKGLLKDIPVEKVRDFEKDFLDRCRLQLKSELAQIARGEFSDDIADALTNLAKEVSKNYIEYKK
jgi:F-type H+-transporting ATPase subunit alpha